MCQWTSYSGTTPSTRAYLNHLSRSPAMNIPKASGVLATMVLPSPARRFSISGVRMIRMISAFNFEMTEAGVFAGAQNPFQASAD